MESVFDVAAYILSKESMKHSKLQRLCYYAQSWSIVYLGERMFDEHFEAWMRGPVCPTLYMAYRHFGSLDIPKFNSAEKIKLSQRSKSLIDSIVDAYGEYDWSRLDAIARQEYPWKKAREGCRPSDYSRNIISEDDMRMTCLEMLKKRKGQEKVGDSVA